MAKDGKRGGILKKIVWLLVVTAIGCGIVRLIGESRRPDQIEIETMRLSASSVAETVSCSGRVENAAEHEVRAEAACVVGQVLVKNGTAVEEGTPLFTVDRAATLAVLAQSDGAMAVKTAMDSTAPTVVTAPVSGVVTGLNLEAGDMAAANSVCAVIAENEPVQIRLSIPERSIRRVAVGQRVAVSGIGFVKKNYAGTIREISSVAKEKINGTVSETMVEAIVSLDRGVSDKSLRVGLTAKANITVTTDPSGFIIPYDAVLEDEKNQEFVYILAGERAQKRVITPKAELDAGYLVTEDLRDGEEVILTPEKVTAQAVLIRAGEER